jgi:predicted nuclease of predicted toxin-antitoxin system
MRLLIDENVAQDVADAFIAAGHDVVLARDALARSTPDQLVAITGAIAGRIVVTHDKDFTRFARLLPQGFRLPLKTFGRIHLNIREDLAAARVTDLMPVIESIYRHAMDNRRRLQLKISATRIDSTDHSRPP